MKIFPNRSAALITLSVCFIVVALVSWILSAKSNVFEGNMPSSVWMISVPLYILQFLVLLYFISSVKTIKKALLYSVFIPYYCCIILCFVAYIAIVPVLWGLNFSPALPDWNLYLYERFFDMINNILYKTYVFSGSWLISIFLLMACGLHLYVLNRKKQCLEKQEIVSDLSFQKVVMKMRLFQHKELTYGTVAIFLIFMIIYALVFRLFWLVKVDSKWIAIYIYTNFYSLLSFLILAPAIIGQTKRAFIFCIVVPFIWCLIISIILAITLLASTGNYDVFSLRFYLDFYLKPQAWFISLSLLLICYFYTRLAKSELTRRMKTIM